MLIKAIAIGVVLASTPIYFAASSQDPTPDPARTASDHSPLEQLQREVQRLRAELEELHPRMRVVPHQANGRIVDGLTKKMGLPKERVTKTIHRVGNISAASNLIALDYTMRKGNLIAEHDPETGAITAIKELDKPIQRGEMVVLPTIGAGYLYGAVGFVNSIQ